MASVQFRDLQSIVKAYQNRGVADWAIFQGKQFMFVYSGGDLDEGAAQLAEIVSALSQSAAIYTLCVYEDLQGSKIKSNTAYDGSFNFRLNEYDAQNSISGYRGGVENTGLSLAIEKLNSRIDALETVEDENEIPEEKTLVSQFVELMQVPAIGEIISGFIMGKNNVAGARIAGVENCGADSIEAFKLLCSVVPDFEGKIKKLAEMYNTNRPQFDTLVSFLNYV